MHYSASMFLLQIMEMKQEIWTLSLKSKPHRDPCRRLSVAAGQEGSYDDLLVSSALRAISCWGGRLG